LRKKRESIGKTPHAARTVGSWYGHLFRRLIHVSMLVIPLIYYAYGESIARFLHLTTTSLLLFVLVIAFFSEFLRISFGFVIFGQRRYEARQISAFAWGVFAMVIVLLFFSRS